MEVVFNGSKILIWKQITTAINMHNYYYCCFQWFKDTNLKANHNLLSFIIIDIIVVFNGSKILIWKQITTCYLFMYLHNSCFQWFKDTNLKANHNRCRDRIPLVDVVFNGSKILIWKQITTPRSHRTSIPGCFQWFKDTNLKANHNCGLCIFFCFTVVFNGSKILIWKQITTPWKKS